MKKILFNNLKLLTLGLVIALSGAACSKKKKNNNVNNNNNPYYGPGRTNCGNPTGNQGSYQGYSIADFGRGGAVLELDMFSEPNGQIYAVGELYIPDLNSFDPAFPPGSTALECVSGRGTVVEYTHIADELQMTLEGDQGTIIIMGGQNPAQGTTAITEWSNNTISGSLHMKLGGNNNNPYSGGNELLTYTLSP